MNPIRETARSAGDDREKARARFHSLAGIRVPKSKKEHYALARKIKSLRNIKP